jgi:hypothetical protein
MTRRRCGGGPKAGTVEETTVPVQQAELSHVHWSGANVVPEV